MPLLLFLRLLLMTALRLLWSLLAEFVWPAIGGLVMKVIAWTGMAAVFKYARDFIAYYFATGALETATRGIGVGLMLAVWATFLLVVFNFGSWETLKTCFSANPFEGLPSLAGALYLATHFFPFRFFFGTMFAYVIWRMSCIGAAITFNRTLVLVRSGVKF